MSAALPFTVFRRVAGLPHFEPVARISASSFRDATVQAERILPAAVVCHAHTGEREAVDFSQVPPPRRSRRHH